MIKRGIFLFLELKIDNIAIRNLRLHATFFRHFPEPFSVIFFIQINI